MAQRSLQRDVEMEFGTPSVFAFSAIPFPIAEIQSKSGSVRVLVPPPSASAEAVRISCSASEAGIKREGEDKREMSVGMTAVRSLSYS
jgi:hypothetical protein